MRSKWRSCGPRSACHRRCDATSTTSRFLGPRLMSALLAARTGHIEEARRAADALRLEFPFDTIVQKYGLPLIDATVRLHLNDPAGAVAALEPATKYDLSYTNSIFPALYSSYVRGTAYFRMNEFAAAAAEFQRILTHPGLVGRWVFGPLARLHLARTQRAMGDDAAALSSYEAFLEALAGRRRRHPALPGREGRVRRAAQSPLRVLRQCRCRSRREIGDQPSRTPPFPQ